MSQPILISREPVLNRSRAITATRLAIRAPAGPAACAQFAAELNRLAEAWPQARTVFVGLGGVAPDKGLLDWQVPQNAMIEIPAAALNNPATLEMVQQLQAAGVSMCLDGYSAGMALPADADFRFLLANATANTAGAPGLLIAKGLVDNAQFDACIQKGFGGAAGWYFLKGVTPAKKLNPGQAQTIRLLNLVRANADVKEIEAALKQDVALSVKLLRYINSAGFGLAVEIQSFRHAVTMLGYEKLNKWLSLLLVTSSKDAAAPALMQAAIARGRFMELTAKDYVDKNELDNLFITGAFSLLDILLGVLMETALADMHLPDTINDALVSGSGPYAPFLALARAGEQNDYDRFSAQAAELQLDAATINHAQLEALSFADSLQAG
ncbi:MAG: HDOD domain-containing protein [Betaproteobacteria bacterium]|nr:HDOD domain-containing protein [Betaproteobacteria bacterium]